MNTNKNSTNKEIAFVLKEAKIYLSESHNDGKTEFICFALTAVTLYKDTFQYYDATVDAKFIINKRLGKSYSVSNWLVNNKILTTKELNAAKLKGEVQKYRHRWLDSLILEFSA